MNIPQLLIAAPHSGSGKTLFTLALLRLLSNRGLAVQPFKCGPDYLDTQLHGLAARRGSYNLDLFMSDSTGVRNRYAKQVATADAAIVEGVMGMFDGYNQSRGSSAEVARTLDIPIIMVMNAKAMAHSAAALLHGFATYQQGCRPVGVVFNFVGSASHYEYLRQAALEVGVEPLGWIKANENLKVESRHLGLHTENHDAIESICESAASEIFANVDVDRLLAITMRERPQASIAYAENTPRLRAAVARDEAFSFIYPANIEALEQVATVTYFSPLADDKLPEADFVYLPGGYPELHAQALSGNSTMLESIRRYSQRGGLMLAECGGMMYLGSELTLASGESYPMAKIYNFGTTFQNARCKLGYRQATVRGLEVRGHEFHYSSIFGEAVASSLEVRNALGNPSKTGIFVEQQTVASYFHFYWGDTPISIIDVVKAMAMEGK